MGMEHGLRPKFIGLPSIHSKAVIPLWLKETALILGKSGGKILGHFNIADYLILDNYFLSV